MLAAVRGGRVAQTGFLEPDAAASLAEQLRAGGASVAVWGGYPGARRRVVTAYPDTIPEASTPLAARYAEGVGDAGDLRVALGRLLTPADIGDILPHQAGMSAVLLAKAAETLPATLAVAGRDVPFIDVPLERVAGGHSKRRVVIVPSLRVDALGAKALGVSRAYFSKGVAAGNVSVNGRRASKASSAGAGDEVYAEGLGRFHVLSVQGETRRGNLKVEVEVEKA